MMNKFEAYKRSITEVFGYIYKIPFYQRGYSWKKEQVKQSWDDLMMVVNEDQSEYFLGSMVLNEKREYFEVIDGQQRLTTVTIFLCAVRDYLLLKDETARKSAERIHRPYIAEQDLRGRDEYRLTL